MTEVECIVVDGEKIREAVNMIDELMVRHFPSFLPEWKIVETAAKLTASWPDGMVLNNAD